MTGEERTGVGSSPWRTQVLRRQREALPAWDRVTITCTAPLGGGGLGRHLEELARSFATGGTSVRCVCEGSSGLPAAGVDELVVPLPTTAVRALRALEPLGRLSPAIRIRLSTATFDLDAVPLLPAEGGLLGFNSTSLRQLRAARARGGDGSLVSATVHARRLVDMHLRARRRDPIERPWSPGILDRNLREYELAEAIYVSSRLAWESFVAAGIAEERLRMFPLIPGERYRPQPGARARSTTFDVVYVGGVTVDKGVPVLVDAVRRLHHPDLRLRLVGGWKTPGMRRFMRKAMREDRRIEIQAGDPLPVLQAASLYVHAAWSDGFGYAPAEAMACGVPVLVTEDTGMKELVGVAGPGAVLPTGDAAVLAEAIDAAYRGEPFAAGRERDSFDPTL